LACEFKAVAVGVPDAEHPHIVADEGVGHWQVSAPEFMVEGEGVRALGGDRDAEASVWCMDMNGMVFTAGLLEHEGDEVAGKPAPFYFSAWAPLVGEGKAQSVAIEVEGLLHVGDIKEGYREFEVGFVHFCRELVCSL